MPIILEGVLEFCGVADTQSKTNKQRKPLKIAVMASPHNTSAARTAMVRLETSGHDTVGLKFSDRWHAERRTRIESLLAGSTHVLCVVDEADTKSSWFAYIVGYTRGKGMPLALNSLDPEFHPAPWLEETRIFFDLDSAEEHYSSEGIEWTQKENRRLAKAALLERGISWHGESLAQCVRDGDTESVKLFIASGFPPDVRDKAGVPLLCLAARFKHRNVVDLLLDCGADINAQSDDRGYSPLMDAAQQGDSGLLAYLLKHGSDPDLQSKDGQTALVLAVGRSDAMVVARLLEHGASPDIADKLGLTARKYAKLFHNEQIDAAFANVI